MHGDVCNRAEGAAALLGPSEIECGLQANATQNRDIGLRQVTEMVGAEDVPPPHRSAVLAGVTAKVAKITGAGEVEVADGSILHLAILFDPGSR